MEIKHSLIDNIAVVLVKGNMSLENARIADDYLEKLVRDSEIGGMILNLQAAKYVDSSGVGAMVSAYKELDAQKKYFALCSVSKNLYTILKMVNLHTVLKIFETEEEALSHRTP